MTYVEDFATETAPFTARARADKENRMRARREIRRFVLDIKHNSDSVESEE